MNFKPDFTNILSAANNQKPKRLPLYEHIISPAIMEKILNVKFADRINGNENDIKYFFSQYCRFFKEMTYDTVSYEAGVIETLPDFGALWGGKPGPVQNRKDFDKYPWDELGARFWNYAQKRFDILVKQLPEGMKIIGGIGNGVFEISEDVVGLEYLAYMQIDEPALYSDIYNRIGDLLVSIWKRFLEQYADYFAVCRFGDDLGFRISTLTSVNNIRQYILPQYKRIISLIKSFYKPFLWHSCGRIFDIMDDVIELGINAKHSNEDAIAPFDKWIDQYGNRIGLFGGIDVDLLCQSKPYEIKSKVLEDGRRFRSNAKGYALGSGNSIPDYIPVDSFLAMIEAVQELRASE